MKRWKVADAFRNPNRSGKYLNVPSGKENAVLPISRAETRT